ncbi:MAG: hypothetical protein V3575_03780 [Candidatus Absconditabacteria bacterium]
MKKILALILFYLLISYSYGNRDDSFTRVWRTNVHNPLNVSIEINNTAPGGRTIKIPKTNLFDLANLVTQGSCRLSRNSNNVDITYSQTSRGSPPTYVNCNFFIDIHQSTLRNYVKDHLIDSPDLKSSIKETERNIILDSINYGLKDKFAVTLKIAVDSNGRGLSPLQAFFPPYELEYSYFYMEECYESQDKSCTATIKNGYNFQSSLHEELQTQTKKQNITNGEKISSLSAICDNSKLIYGKELTVTNCNEGFVLNGGACVINDCQGTIPDNAEQNGTQDAGLTWTYNNSPGECKFKCISGYNYEGGECKSTSGKEELKVTKKEVNPLCSNPPDPKSLPACSDGVDNDGDGRIDYPNDSCCFDKNDTSEGGCLIQPDHKIPSIEWENVNYYNTSFNDIQLIDNSIVNSPIAYSGTISYFSDIINNTVSTYFVPIGKVRILENGVDTNWSGRRNSNVGISRFSFTVMNAAGTSPLPYDYCRYSGSYVGNQVLRKGSEFVFYLDSRCTEAFKQGKYSLSVEAIDEYGYSADKYSSNNNIFALNSVLGNVDLKKSQISIDTSGKLGDIKECVPVSGTLKDSNGSIIPNRQIVNIGVINNSNYINEITKTGDPIWYKNPTNIINGLKNESLSTDNQGKFSSCIYSYNKTDNNNQLKLSINQIEITNSSPYWQTNNNYITKEYDSVPVFDKLIRYTITGDSQLQIGFDHNISLDVNNLSTNNITNAYFRFKMIIKSQNTDVTDKFKIIPLDDNANKILGSTFTNLKDNSYYVNEFKGNSKINMPLKFRLEQVDGTLLSTDLTITGELGVDYVIKNKINNTDTKNVVAKFLPDSDLSALYWGVKVVGLSSSNSNFFKITDSVGTDIQTTNNFASSSLNIIKQNIINLTRGIEMKNESININGKISGINITTSNIYLSGSIVGKSLVYSEGGDIVIKGNILKQDGGVLTIAAIGGRIIIDPSVTEIHAILITDKGIFSFENNSKNEDTVKGLNNSILNNQLLIKGSIISLGNSIGGAISIGGEYFLPKGEKTTDFYKAAFYDLNYLRRYHFTVNKGLFPSSLDQSIYGINPVVIMLDSDIQGSSPYGF